MLLGSWKSPGIFCNQESGNPGLSYDVIRNVFVLFTSAQAKVEVSVTLRFACYLGLKRNFWPQVKV